MTDAREEQGGGVTAVVDGLSVAAGNRRFMRKLGIDCKDPEDAGTVVHVAAEGAYMGCILLSDAPKPSARAAIAEVEALGAKVVMLTGDSEQAAALAADELGISDYRAALLPEGKVEQLEALIAGTNGRVAFGRRRRKRRAGALKGGRGRCHGRTRLRRCDRGGGRGHHGR